MLLTINSNIVKQLKHPYMPLLTKLHNLRNKGHSFVETYTNW